MSEAFRTTVVAFGALAAGFTWLSLRTTSIAPTSPQRLIAELRLAQIAALLLTLIAGAYVGLAVVRENEPGVGLDIAFAIGFMITAAWTMMRDPRQALTIMSMSPRPNAAYRFCTVAILASLMLTSASISPDANHNAWLSQVHVERSKSIRVETALPHFSRNRQAGEFI